MERFEKEISSLTDYFSKTVTEVKSDFTDDIRNMQKLRARDKSDAEVKLKDINTRLEINSTDILKHHEYFGALAQGVSILTENLNI